MLQPDDPQAIFEKIKKTVMEKVEVLIKHGVFNYIQRQVVPCISSILPYELALAIKAEGNADEQYKARLFS